MNHAHMPKLEGRKIPFEFADNIEACWIPNQPQLSAMMNGASLTMPYLEPFLIRTIREASKQIDDKQLRADIAGFASQESYHFRTHRRFNDLLTEQHYPELRRLEEKMQASYARLNKRSLQTRMAYTAGFEAMTMGVTRWLIGDRVKLFAGADPAATSFVLWHMVEETEHKRVAYDVYQALYGDGIRAYFRRAIGVFHGSMDVVRFSRQGYIMMLKSDGIWRNLKSRLRLYKWVCEFLGKAMPFLLRAALPNHDPRDEQDLEWVTDWLEGYDHHPEQVPIVDTSDPMMPVPFSANANEVPA
ncbi:MAG: metal-dependent hydrolase [Pseudomonadota bacterium]